MTFARNYYVAQIPKLLEARNLVAAFGGVQALVSFNLSMDPGQIIAIIGPHGSGKSTVIDLLSGVRPPRSGFAQIKGRSMIGQPPEWIARRGIIRTFQTPRLFWERSAIDNVAVAVQRPSPGLLGTLLHTPSANRAHARARRTAMDLLATMELADQAKRRAAELDFAQRRRLEIARALGCRPRILLLDEPAGGLAPAARTALGELILFLREQFGIGICFTADTPDVAMDVADQIIVLDHGHTVAAGSPEELAGDAALLSRFAAADDHP